MASLDPALHRYEAARATRFFEELGERLSGQPSIELVARASSVPLSLNIVRTAVSRESPHAMSASNRLSVDVAAVDEHYFRTMGIPLLRGRAFEVDDRDNNTRAAVVNRTLADRLWPGERAVNQRIFLGDGKPREVVGVVKTGKYLSLGEEPKPFLYVPLATTGNSASTIIVKAGPDVSARVALSTLTNEILELDPELAIYDAKTMEEHLGLSFLPARASATVAGFFGAAALVLVAAGLYGVLAQGGTERTREIGIRRALGAETADVLGLFLRQGLAMVLSGLALGLPAAIALGTVSRSVLHGAVVSDPKTWGLAIALLLAASALACWLPSRRAARVAPGEALRYE
jgi:predicted permease